jgi:hypothetical protein
MDEMFLGSYLYPPVFLRPIGDNLVSAAEIIDEIKIDNYSLLITKMGGLFTNLPNDLIGERKDDDDHLLSSHLENQLKFEQSVCDCFTQLICELSLLGEYKQPITPAYLGIGKRRDNLLITESTGGAPSMFLDRVFGPVIHTMDKNYFYESMNTISEVYDEAKKLLFTTKLKIVSAKLPLFIASAFSEYSQHQLEESLIDAWVACEQLINHYWKIFINMSTNKERRERLKDERTYSSSVKLEVLYSSRIFQEDLYNSLQIARKHRNNLIHDIKIDYYAVMDTFEALRGIIEFYTGYVIKQLPTSSGPLWFYNP